MKSYRKNFLYFIFFTIVIKLFNPLVAESKKKDPIITQTNEIRPLNITTPEQAFKELINGNAIYMKQWDTKERKSVAAAQHPFAIILTCSDSRVAPEIIFDELHLGSLFIIRNAGNIADNITIGSIEYGIEHLGALLIVVLGHERCGAVTTAIDLALTPSKKSLSIGITAIIDMIAPAVQNIIKMQPDIIKNKDLMITQAIKENVKLTTKKLYQNSQIIKHAIDLKKIKIVGAYYDLNDGNVQIII